MSFKPVDPKINFVEMENKWLLWWKENKILEKYLEKNKNSSKKFSFIDGPITANSPMGVHHAWGRTYKDLWQRFKNMQGFEQRFQNGFDCQGLWVEVEVEKALGFNSKKDIEKYGLDKFTNACKDRVNTFAKIQTEQSIRLGSFMDWDNSYYTMSEKNNLYIWRFLKICHERRLIYKSKAATTWCPRCETGLSKHEQADSYKEVTDTAVYVKFKLKNCQNEYFLVWTTTPWTLSANILLAINTQHEYVKAKLNNGFYYLARQSADRIGLKDYSTVNAKELINLEYEAIYDIPAQKDVKHYVVQWEVVDPMEGTGIVHIAPGCGEEDFELGKKLNVPAISPLNEAGIFMEGYGDLSGEYAHNVADKVVNYLKNRNSLFKTEKYTHSYPHCWRCKTKCLFRLEENWFINCQKMKEGLKKTAEKAKWIPDFVGKRMQNWLDNMGDWMISRKRFYGLALPFYECKKCGRLTVVGNKEELKQLSVAPELVDNLPSLHRPWMDEVKIRCPECGQSTSRVKEVGDCWLDAGVVPFSTLKYFEDIKYWEKWFPADFICEMVEQVRLWYYSMLVYGYIFENKIPYKTVLSYVEVRDEKGERMSKTKANGIPYDEAVDKMGADVMRWMYVTQNPELNLNFGYHLAGETRRRFHLFLWNVYNFFVTYANLDKFKVQSFDGVYLEPIRQAQGKLRREAQDKSSKACPEPAPYRSGTGPVEGFKADGNVLDRWILSRLNNLIKTVTDSLEDYDAYSASWSIENFVNDLSTWYIRRSRDRVGPTAPKRNDKNNFYSTTYLVLSTLSKLSAPFLPFLSEEIFKNLSEEESVHLQGWPLSDESLIDNELEKQMEFVRKIVEVGHAKRKELGIKVRQPLAKFKVQSFDFAPYQMVQGFAQDRSSKFKVDRQLISLIEDELNVKEVTMETGEGELQVSLDTKITPELKAEGEARDIIRQIQEARKKLGCNLDEKVEVGLPLWPKDFEEEIKKNTLVKFLYHAEKLEIKR